MTQYLFSIYQPNSYDNQSGFFIKVSSDDAQFILNEEISIHVPGDCPGDHYYLDCTCAWQSPEDRPIQKINDDLFDKILNVDYLSKNEIIGQLCGVSWKIDANKITVGHFTVPSREKTRESFVTLLQYYNEEFDKLDSSRATNILHPYVDCLKRSITDEPNRKYLNEYFRSGKGSDEFRAEYVKVLLEYGSI